MPNLSFLAMEGETLSAISDATSQITTAIDVGLNEVALAIVGASVAVVGVGMLIFAIKQTPKLIMKLFKVVSNA